MFLEVEGRRKSDNGDQVVFFACFLGHSVDDLLVDVVVVHHDVLLPTGDCLAEFLISFVFQLLLLLTRSRRARFSDTLILEYEAILTCKVLGNSGFARPSGSSEDVAKLELRFRFHSLFYPYLHRSL